MVARCRVFAIVLFAIVVLGVTAAPAGAQLRLARIASPSTSQDSPYAGSQYAGSQYAGSQYAGSQVNTQSPTIDQLARRAYSQSSLYEQSCLTSRDRQQLRVAQAQQRRDAEQARRQASRERLPRPIQGDEQLAASKFQLAHLLWQHGNTPAARKWLGEILDKFPSTETAYRARLVLARI